MGGKHLLRRFFQFAVEAIVYRSFTVLILDIDPDSSSIFLDEHQEDWNDKRTFKGISNTRETPVSTSQTVSFCL